MNLTVDHDCEEATSVLHTQRKDGCWHRRRECLVCHRRFNTVERIAPVKSAPKDRRERRELAERVARLEAKVARIYPGAFRDGGDG